MRDICRLLVRDLRAFQREISAFPDDASAWRTAPGIANSAGNLALHACGNLRHFVGGVLGGVPYVRDREDEFGRRTGTRAALVEDLATTITVVIRAFDGFSPERLEQPFPVAVNGVQMRTQMFLLHLTAHLAFHLGQAGYVRRIVTGDARSMGPMELAVLSDDSETQP